MQLKSLKLRTWITANDNKYVHRLYDKIYELLSFLANISLNEEGKAFGGHLIEGTTAATLEVCVTPVAQTLTRKPHENVGQQVMDI